MKRFIEKLINSINNWKSNAMVEEKIGVVLGIIIGILVGVSIYINLDTIPATPLDYELMEKQVIAIQENPELLLKSDCNVEMKDEIITAVFKNDECKLKVCFNQDFEVISSKKIDLYIFWPLAFLGSLFLGVEVFLLSYYLILILIILGEGLVEVICEKFEIIKSKFQKK